MRIKVLILLLISAFTFLNAKDINISDTEVPITYSCKSAYAASDLDVYLQLAAENNPGLKSAFANWKTLLSVVPQAHALNDPKFTFSYFIEEIETRVGPQRGKIGLSQSFPWFGKLDAKRDSAVALAESARFEFEDQKLELFFKVKKAYYEYSYVAAALAIARDNQKLLEHYEAITHAKYQTSTAAHPDIIRAQIELAVINDIIESLVSLKDPLVSELKQAINFDYDSVDIEFDWPEKLIPANTYIDRNVILSNIIDSPSMLSLRQKVYAAKSAENLASKTSYPDITIGVDWISIDEPVSNVKNGGKDAVAVMFGVNIPLWTDKNNAVRRQAAAGARRAKLRQMQGVNDRVAIADKLIYEINDTKRKMELYKNTLGKKADELVKTSEVAYRSGTLEFFSLIDAQRLRLKYLLNYERAVVDYMQKLAELEKLSGGSLVSTGLE